MRLSRILLCGVLACACGLAQPGPDTKQRVRAARDLVRQGSDALPKLQAMLSDPATAVRVEAVKSIIEVDTAASLDPLILATRDNDPEVQIRATDGLVNFYLPGYVRHGLSASLDRVGGALKAHFTQNEDDEVIDPYIHPRPEVVAALGKLARGGSSMESRANAARAIGILRGQAAIPDLIQALHSKDSQVIYEGLIALQKIRDPEAAPRISFLLHDLDDKVQTAAIETTGLLRNRAALPDLRSVLADTRNAKVRRAALTAIAMLPDPASRPVYTSYLSDKDDWMRAAAAEGFARLKTPADLPLVAKAWTGEQKRRAQLADAFALVMLGKTDVAQLSPLQFLLDSLNSSAWKGVSSAYLIELARDPVVRRPVEEATKGATKDEKIALADILARSGDKETLAYLDAMSHDPDTDVAQAALNATRTLKARLQ